MTECNGHPSGKASACLTKRAWVRSIVDSPFGFFLVYFGFLTIQQHVFYTYWFNHYNITMGAWPSGISFHWQAWGHGFNTCQGQNIFLAPIFFSFLTNFNNFFNLSKLIILRWFFAHLLFIICLFCEYVKKFQKYLFFDYFSFNWKQVIFNDFKNISFDCFSKNSWLNLFGLIKAHLMRCHTPCKYFSLVWLCLLSFQNLFLCFKS